MENRIKKYGLWYRQASKDCASIGCIILIELPNINRLGV
jgi:hypothetical protein